MAAFSYRIVNVFTQGRAVLTGNPLCVFERAQALDAQRMQALALQFNLSETSFILPSERASAAVRIFTPRYEMPFAGHPTLGTAHVCRALGLGGDRLTLELPVGIITVQATGERWTLQAKSPAWREVSEPRLTLAAMLGLEERDLAERPLWVNAGAEQLVVPLASEAAVRRVNVRADLLAALGSRLGHGQVYVFAPA
ncbi:MAG TPA: PhzF family phenazine biosynthesis protein, partial [Steroidobacteraceae bacterium]|nr:PhzF family phenazine biosynthesis protein [Steroidobacteraceae bacterium]